MSSCDNLNFSRLVPPKQRKTFTAVSVMDICWGTLEQESILYSYHQKCLLGVFALDHRWLVFIFFSCSVLSSRSAKVDKEVKKRGGGFTKLSSLSPELQKITGVSELARTEVLH